MRKTHLVSIAQGMKWHVWRGDCRQDGLSWLSKARYPQSGCLQDYQRDQERGSPGFECQLCCSLHESPGPGCSLIWVVDSPVMWRHYLSPVLVLESNVMGMLAWQVTVTHTQTHSYPQPPQFILHISAWHPKWTFKILDRIMQLPHFNPPMACHHPENKSTGLPMVCMCPQGCCSNLIFVPSPLPIGIQLHWRNCCPSAHRACPHSWPLLMLFPLTQYPSPDIYMAHPLSSSRSLLKSHIFRTPFPDNLSEITISLCLISLSKFSPLLRHYIIHSFIYHLLYHTVGFSPLYPNAGIQRSS